MEEYWKFYLENSTAKRHLDQNCVWSLSAWEKWHGAAGFMLRYWGRLRGCGLVKLRPAIVQKRWKRDPHLTLHIWINFSIPWKMKNHENAWWIHGRRVHREGKKGCLDTIWNADSSKWINKKSILTDIIFLFMTGSHRLANKFTTYQRVALNFWSFCF